MKLGIMQPYFMPYISYWQLMNAVDKYVIYDDVNYIKGGWINRNRILLNGQPHYINVQMEGASSFKAINEVKVNLNEFVVSKNLRLIESAYRKAPYYADVFPILEQILRNKEETLSGYIAYSFTIICEYLDIKTELLISSDLKKDCTLKAQDKVLSICKILGATEYYNAIDGQALYSAEDFRRQGIELKFIKTDEIRYQQFNNDFCGNLSIIDVMMFNSVEKIKEMLALYTLI